MAGIQWTYPKHPGPACSSLSKVLPNTCLNAEAHSGEIFNMAPTKWVLVCFALFPFFQGVFERSPYFNTPILRRKNQQKSKALLFEVNPESLPKHAPLPHGPSGMVVVPQECNE